MEWDFGTLILKSRESRFTYFVTSISNVPMFDGLTEATGAGHRCIVSERGNISGSHLYVYWPVHRALFLIWSPKY